MKNRIILFIVFICLLTGCEYDNYKAPQSQLSGKIVYNNEPLSVRANANQLELWQDGYELRNKIPVYISWDGTYHATLFDGDYKLVRLAGAPWENQTDTIPIIVKGKTVIDVPVIPYFTLRDVNFQKEDNLITATFIVDKVSIVAQLSSVRLFLGSTILTSKNSFDANVSLSASLVIFGNVCTVQSIIPAKLASHNFLYARIGVENLGVGELLYSLPQKIQLK